MAALSNQDLPPLYCDFDESSTAAQRAYLRVIKTDLALLVTAAGVSSFSSTNRDVQRLLYGVGAALLIGGLLMTIILSRNAYERTWYGGRAAAETVKSLAWKYMLRAAPFEGEADSSVADSTLLHNFADVLHERRDLAVSSSALARTGEPITKTMRDVRGSGALDRMAVYVSDRVQDQIRWYSSKSRENERAQAAWLYGIVALQAAAAVGALFQVARPDLAFNFASTLAAVATAILAWSQLKRHRELAQSYSLAAHELGLATGFASRVQSETELSQFVNDTETAISREHTMWIARREAAP